MTRALFSCSLVLLLLTSALLTVRAQDAEDILEAEEDGAFEAERAFLIVRKYAAHKEVVKGSNTTITIELYNAGNRSRLNALLRCLNQFSGRFKVKPIFWVLCRCWVAWAEGGCAKLCSAAQDVIVTEGAWPSQSFVVDESKYEASFERIASGATVKHEYSVLAVDGPHYVRTEPATVFYRPEYASQDTQVGQASCYSEHLTLCRCELRSILVTPAENKVSRPSTSCVDQHHEIPKGAAERGEPPISSPLATAPSQCIHCLVSMRRIIVIFGMHVSSTSCIVVSLCEPHSTHKGVSRI